MAKSNKFFWIRAQPDSGETIIEVAVAASVMAFVLLGVCGLNWTSLCLLRANKEHLGTSLCLQERVEALRNTSWANITSPTYLQTMVGSGNAAMSSISVPGLSEEIIVNSFPTATTANDVVRASNGTVTLTSSNSALSSQNMVKVDLIDSWPAVNGQTHKRVFSTIITNGGITR